MGTSDGWFQFSMFVKRWSATRGTPAAYAVLQYGSFTDFTEAWERDEVADSVSDCVHNALKRFLARNPHVDVG